MNRWGWGKIKWRASFEFEGPIFGGAYIRRGLFSEFYGMSRNVFCTLSCSHYAKRTCFNTEYLCCSTRNEILRFTG